MAQGASIPDWHVLDFFCDDKRSCALTALVRGFRFHIIVQREKLTEASLRRRYDELVDSFNSGETGNASSTPTSADNNTDTDSGIDVNDGEHFKKEIELNPEEALQRFMLEPLAEELNKLSKAAEEETVQEWYNGPTYFYNIASSEKTGEARAIQLEEMEDLTERMVKLKPEIILAKSMTDKLDVLIYRASSLTVITTSDQPPGTPYHPCRVRRNNPEETLFLKIVDNSQPQPVKRELDILYKAMELKLNREINVPRLEGLVAFDDAEDTKLGQRRIMGFLQTDIPDAKPLTEMLDPAVDQSKRENWAKEAERAKEVLHQHGIIWGDAKADNFVVDKDDKLWIIDFGGSFTEGWVDAEIKETFEGDDMGTERIVNALVDPVANTMDPEDEEQQAEADGESDAKADGNSTVTFSPDRERKRKREASVTSNDQPADDGQKARRKS